MIQEQISYPAGKLLKQYYFALGFYILPFICLMIFLIDQFTINRTEMWFWVLFLVSLAPCGLIGLLLSIWGLVRSSKLRTRRNQIAGAVGIFLGICLIVGGILAILFIVAVVAAVGG